MNDSTYVRLYVMCGAPGSGKTTWASTHLPHIPYVSRDDIRFSLLKPGEDYFSHEKEVWNQFISKIAHYANAGRDVCIDATHINIASRNKLYRSLESWLKVNYEIHWVVMDTCFSKCLKRNETREGLQQVPESAIRNMYDSMSTPTLQEANGKVKSVWLIRN